MQEKSALELLADFIGVLNGFAWGPWMLVLILGTGAFLMIMLKFIPLRRMGYGFRLLSHGLEKKGEGDISPFHALMTSLSATIGTGNIAGVATAIGVGGPGALFWMWCSALVGMATKYAEAVCAVQFRETDEDGKHIGGPMYYIKNGLGKNWMWLGITFAVFGSIAGFGIGNAVQANSVADAVHQLTSWEATLRISFLWIDIVVLWVDVIVGMALMFFAGLVLIGGIKRISNFAGVVVPFMAVAYLIAGLLVLILNINQIPDAIWAVLTSAFTGTAATGGFAGAAVMLAIEMGVKRGVFSNEAGLGSAPIAHAAARTNSPVRQGLIAMLGTFIDTIVICSITGLAIVVTGVWSGEAEGAAMTMAAFSASIPIGELIITVGLIFFAFTTILGWSYYGERCAQFLFGTKVELPFRIAWILVLPIGACATGLDLVWDIADTLNGFMAIPNLIALLLLSGVVAKLTKEYFATSKKPE